MTNSLTTLFDTNTTFEAEGNVEKSYSNLDELSHVIIEEVRREANKRASMVSSNGNRRATLANDMSAITSEVLFQIMDKPSFWNIRGVRATVNRYMKDYIRRETKHQSRHTTFAGLDLDVSEEGEELGDVVISKLMEVTSEDFSEFSDSEMTIATFFASDFFQSLTENQKYRLELYTNGYSYRDISKITGVELSAIKKTFTTIGKLVNKHNRASKLFSK